MSRVWKLNITSFAVGGGHAYGRVRREQEPVDGVRRYGKGAPEEPEFRVEADLTEEWARDLNTYERDYDWLPGVGYPCERFRSVADCKAAAIVQFLEIAEPGDVLVKDTYYVDEREPIAVKE